MKKMLSLLLIPGLLCAAVSCGQSASPAETTDTDPVSDTEPAKTSLFETLPDADYDGAEFTVLVPTELSYEFSEEQDGDIVNDALFERDQAIEERYNMNFQYITEPGNWAGKDTFNGLIKQSVLADDHAYDLVNGMVAVANLIVTEGVYTDLLTLDGLDFDDPWWAADMDETLTVSGRMFGICGAGLLSMYKSAYIVFYNQKLLDEYKLENPMDLVLEGRWTLDKCLSMTKDVTRDLNADGKYTEDDQYGYLYDSVSQRGYQTSMELKVLERDADGKLIFLGLTERLAAAVDLYKSHISDSSQVWITGGDDPSKEQRIRMFISDQSLFAGETIERIEAYRDMKSDFGMIPQPKFDEAQEDYHVQIGTGSGMYFIPKTVKDLEMTVNILNAINCISMESTVPAYYESALKVKYIRDEKNAAVIDIINRSMTMDETFAYSTNIGGCVNQLFSEATLHDQPIASTVASNESVIKSGIEQLEESFAEIE